MLAPFVNLFIRLGISPDVVTLVGTAGVTAGALIFFPQGRLLAGVLFITAFIFSDLIDGAMARKTGRTSKFGAAVAPLASGRLLVPCRFATPDVMLKGSAE